MTKPYKLLEIISVCSNSTVITVINVCCRDWFAKSYLIDINTFNNNTHNMYKSMEVNISWKIPNGSKYSQTVWLSSFLIEDI